MTLVLAFLRGCGYAILTFMILALQVGISSGIGMLVWYFTNNIYITIGTVVVISLMIILGIFEALHEL